MPKYIICPRCELNYILEGESYCDVCKAELKIGPQLMFSATEEVVEQILCPICKVKYINEDEEMCAKCRENLEYERASSEEDVDKNDDWRQFLDEDEKAVPTIEGEEEMLLSQIEEEEALNDMEEDEDIDPYTNEKISKNKKSDDDDFEYVKIDDEDFEDDEFDDEDEEEDDEEE